MITLSMQMGMGYVILPELVIKGIFRKVDMDFNFRIDIAPQHFSE